MDAGRLVVTKRTSGSLTRGCDDKVERRVFPPDAVDANAANVLKEHMREHDEATSLQA
jgi:hypothetical protein